ncbi:low temperature requirement protein A [Leucobacter rhizosphaerae]|uniref:Low temperature requirement protein A n=1 Tax=Leucobacter rhizosphaerae TaxID=2932245 RepID=A0ABY4FT22_9MICO|nr:low temperature requirement protein A [Leucobacter rhizosphaerae]UOQ59448.1 low temperature requirement protein A [Leucobacter rhizosphaerae]
MSSTSPLRLGLSRMTGRSPHEPHRVASPLELLFDLVFVVAVSQASQNLHHGIVEGHAGSSTLSYAMVFFAIWWAWMNFTWFASAFDTDDWLYRVTTILQMGGVLMLAAGVHDAMANGAWGLVTLGYVVMRIAMVGQWLRLAASDPGHRAVALRFATGISLVQVFWVVRLAFPPEVQFWTFWLAMLLEILVPLWAERTHPTPWHPHHVAERFGLFTLILLGESLLASANAIIDAGASASSFSGLVLLAITGLLIAAGMWWMYFGFEQGDRMSSSRTGFLFGYGHYFLFAAAGAVSAGIEVELDLTTGAGEHLSLATASAALALPVGIFMLAVWAMLLRGKLSRLGSAVFLAAAALVLLSVAVPVSTVVVAAICVVVAVIVVEARRSRV